jgi:hypothetical protein
MNASLTFLLVALCIVITGTLVFFLLEKQHKHNENRWNAELRKANASALASLRLSAYERLIVMLERSRPSSVVLRSNRSGMTCTLLQLEMIRNIREEFDHNVSLQMYVSEHTWASIQQAKSDISELFKVSYSKVNPDDNSMYLSNFVLEMEATVGNPAVENALRMLRIELMTHYA